jgi:putative aldouronate transport system substrate-binding protein
MKKGLLMVLSFFVMGLFLVHAGGRGQRDTGNSATQDIEVVRMDVPGESWLVPYDQTVVMTTARSEQVGVLHELDTDNDTSNNFTRAYKKYLNVDLRTAWVSADYNANINLAIASGDLPDVFNVNNNQFKQLLDAGMLEDVTDAFERNVSQEVKKEYDFVPTVMEPYKQNGRLYGYPLLYYGDIEKAYYMWFRKDWMAELGYSGDPKTIDDMIGIVESMNRRYETKGMAMDKGLDALFGLAPMWHAAPKIWVTASNGRIEYGSVQPEMKSAVAAFADWYKRGLINSNFATEDGDTVKADIINALYGAHPFVQWWGWYAGTQVVENNNRNAYFEPYQLPSVDSKPVLYPLSFPNDTTLVVKKGYKNPDAVMKCINLTTLLVSSARKRGIITEEDSAHYMRTGQYVGFWLRPPTIEYRGWEEAQEFRRTGNGSVFSGSGNLEKNIYARNFFETGDTSNNSLGGFLQVFGDRTSYGIAKSIVDRDEFIRSRLWGATPEAVARYGSTLDDLLLEGFTLIILGQQPVSYFDTLVRNWYTAGGQEMTDAINAMYR